MSPKVSWTVGGWRWRFKHPTQHLRAGRRLSWCDHLQPRGRRSPFPRATFLYGLAIGSGLTIGVVLAIQAALSGPTGAGAVAAIAAVLALVVSIVVLLLNGLGDKRL